MTPGLRAFIDRETAALERGDLDAAVEVNLSWWVDGPHRRPDEVDPKLRTLVGRMQRRVFEVTCDWDDVEETELEPPALGRLGEVSVPVLVLVGGLDLDTVRDTARRVASRVAGARLVEWPQVGHLPSLERPADFVDLIREWTAELARRRP
jgi:3-oxoadipate enol-lactonase